MRASLVARLCALVTVLGCSDFKSVTDASDAEVANKDRAEVADVTDVSDAEDAAENADVVVVDDVAPALDGAADATPDATETSVDVASEDACGLTVCDGACVDTATDPAHCGRCGNACASDQRCVAGACECPTGQRSCGGVCRVTGTSCVVGRGACTRTGQTICPPSGSEPICSVTPGTPTGEVCDNIDNDCDGVVDNGLTRTCYTGPTGTAGMGACRAGTQTCSAGSWGAVCPGEVTPRTETCDDIDNNCDGTIDGAPAAASCPARANATATCVSGACGTNCNAGFADCDGDTGNGCETNVLNDALNCGRCGRICAAPLSVCRDEGSGVRCTSACSQGVMVFDDPTITGRFVVPDDCLILDVRAWGGGGGGGTSNSDGSSPGAGHGGGGGFVSSSIMASPGQTLTVFVGGGGRANSPGGVQGGLNGGGSGGAGDDLGRSGGSGGGGGGPSRVLRGESVLLVAGGGGGGRGGGYPTGTTSGQGSPGCLGDGVGGRAPMGATPGLSAPVAGGGGGGGGGSGTIRQLGLGGDGAGGTCIGNTTIPGTGQLPGGITDRDYTPGTGYGGQGGPSGPSGVFTTGTSGGHGRVVIRWGA